MLRAGSRGARWAIAASLLVGTAAGLGLFTFGYARGYSYVTNDPAACANCHVMSEHYAAWGKASHRAAATCNDCHTPNDLVGKYYVKANNGFWHSFYFTIGGYPDPLRITEGNRRVTEQACRDCHGEITEAIDHGTQAGAPPPPRGTVPAAESPAGRLATRDVGVSGEQEAPRAAAEGSRRRAVSPDGHSALAGEPISCIRCHKYVGHWVR